MRTLASSITALIITSAFTGAQTPAKSGSSMGDMQWTGTRSAAVRP